MKNKVEILSRKAAKLLIEGEFPKHTAVISFHDPDDKPLMHKGCDRVFCIAIHDIDIECLPEFGLAFDTYFPEAPALAAFIKTAVADGCNILCQCEYGQSRSAACAAAIREYYDREGIRVYADYRYYPNQMIFNKLLAALRGE